MTPLLEQAIVKVTQLPSLQQDAIASLIFEELLDELEWDNRFAEITVCGNQIPLLPVYTSSGSR